jgi:glycosyltransferase involved in cell wall biosynthesis
MSKKTISKMKILLVANYATDAIQSMEKFASVLETGLTSLGHQVQVIRPQPVMGRIKRSPQGLGKWLGYIDKYILFPSQLRQGLAWADIVHICDHSNAIYIRYLQNFPHLITCHDLLAIRSALGEISENKTGWTGKQLQKMILQGLNQAQYVACISEQTRNDLTRLSKLRPEKISMIYMGLNYPYQTMEQQAAQSRLVALRVPQSCPFILHVGNNAWYKNRLGVLTIFNYLTQKNHHAELYLVMAGQPFTQEMQQFITTHNLQQKVIELINVTNEDLCALYSLATALLFPSLQEGFGWPIIEAQACGCPVFTSHIPPMTEVGGDAAIYINPHQPEATAEIIANYLPQLNNFKQKNWENAQRFTQEQMIHSYAEVYQQIINQN